MNKFITYIAIGAGISIVAITIFAFLGNGSFSRVVFNEDKINQITATSNPVTVIAPIDVKIKNVVANKTADKNAANIKVAFDIHNPNANTMILDGIRYNNILMTSGNIGTEAPEDVIRSQQGFPIIGNSTETLKDTHTIQRNNINTVSWDKMIEAKTSYVIKGTYSYRQTANLQASGGAKEFSLTFP
jgi:hypothetical protein